MAINSRFARRRDGLVRLKVNVSGDALSALEQVWPVRYRLCNAQGLWESSVTVEPGAMKRFFGTVRALGGEWGDFAEEKERRWQELGVHEVRAPSERGDPQLRALVRKRLEGPGILVIDELGIGNGRVRADVAALSSLGWRGVEIKGERDTLARLAHQSEVYAQVFDRCELVVAQEHAKAGSKVPEWWGLHVVGPEGATLVRSAVQSPEVSALARAQLLWREEALTALRGAGGAKGMSKVARSYVWAALVDALAPEELSAVVLAALVARDGWLTDGGRGRVGTAL